MRRSQWPHGLRRRSTAARLLRLWVRIPPGAWMTVCCECCVLSGRGLCDALITRLEESYRLCCVAVCDLETLRIRRPWPALGRSATGREGKGKDQLRSIRQLVYCFTSTDRVLFYTHKLHHNYLKFYSMSLKFSEIWGFHGTNIED